MLKDQSMSIVSCTKKGTNQSIVVLSKSVFIREAIFVVERSCAFMEVFITWNLLLITVNTTEILMTVNLLGLTFNTSISIRIKEQKFKTFIKPFETPQENVKVNISVNFYLNTTGGFLMFSGSVKVKHWLIMG